MGESPTVPMLFIVGSSTATGPLIARDGPFGTMGGKRTHAVQRPARRVLLNQPDERQMAVHIHEEAMLGLEGTGLVPHRQDISGDRK
jgi:hypothetical protein